MRRASSRVSGTALKKTESPGREHRGSVGCEWWFATQESRATGLAATPAAAKAFRMKSYSSMVMMAVAVMLVALAVVMRMVGALDVAAAREHKNVSLGMHHLDIGAVKF